MCTLHGNSVGNAANVAEPSMRWKIAEFKTKDFWFSASRLASRPCTGFLHGRMSCWINNSRSVDPRQIDSAFFVDRRTINYVKQIQWWSAEGWIMEFHGSERRETGTKILIMTQLVSIRFQSPVSRPASTGTHENNWIEIPRWISMDFFQLAIGPKDDDERNKNWFPFEAIWSRRPGLQLTQQQQQLYKRREKQTNGWQPGINPRHRHTIRRSYSRLTRRVSQKTNKYATRTGRDRNNKRVEMWV